MSGNDSGTVSPIPSPVTNPSTPPPQSGIHQGYHAPSSSNKSLLRKSYANSSKSKPRFVPDAFHVESLVGLKFFTIRNQYGCYVVPSEENFIAGFQFPKLKVDEQANRILLPIFDSDMLRELCHRYGNNQTDYHLSLSQFRTRQSPVFALTVKAKHKRAHITVSLGNDIYPESLVETGGSFLITNRVNRSESCTSDSGHYPSVSVAVNESPMLPSSERKSVLSPSTVSVNNNHNNSVGKCSVKVPRIDFFLCSEDMTYLLSPENGSSLSLMQNVDDFLPKIRKLHTISQTHRHLIQPRRFDGVIGNTIMKRYSTIRHMNVEFVFNAAQHFLEDLSWQVLEETALQIHQYSYLSANNNQNNNNNNNAIITAVNNGNACNPSAAAVIDTTTSETAAADMEAFHFLPISSAEEKEKGHDDILCAFCPGDVGGVEESLNDLLPNDVIFDVDQTTGIYANLNNGQSTKSRSSSFLK